MVAGPTRADANVIAGLTRWLRDAPHGLGTAVTAIARPQTGWSNETVLVTTDATRFVVRLPALVPAYPAYDLAAQGDVLRMLAAHGIPAPGAIAIEEETQWLGAPFLVMTWVQGQALGDVPAHDPVLASLSREQRRLMHEQYVDAIAAVHATSSDLPRLRHGLVDELAYWRDYLDWSTDGSPPRRLGDALAWCATTAPIITADVLLWGDPRLGNAMYADGRLVALLDWELASFGPAEMDLAWYVALGQLTEMFTGPDPEGLLTTTEILDRHARSTGRAVEHFDWHQIFALVRSTAINDCMARLAAAHHLAFPGVAGDANPLLDVIEQRISATSG